MSISHGRSRDPPLQPARVRGSAVDSAFPETLAYLLFGVLAWRTGVARDASRHLTLLRGIAAGGIVGGAALTALGHDTASVGGFASALLAPSVMAVGYGAALLLLLQYPGPRSALHDSRHRGAGVTKICRGWSKVGCSGRPGLSRVSAAHALAWGIAAYVAQALFSRWWLARFRFGPLEGLWRRATYGRA